MKNKLSLCAFIALAVLVPLSAQSAVTSDILVEARWYNDEFSFDFAYDGSFVSYYTQGPVSGTLKGLWKIVNDSTVYLSFLSADAQYNKAVLTGDTIILRYTYDQSNPKSQKILRGPPDGALTLWNKKAFVGSDTAIALSPDGIPCVTTGYRLTATTDNLRIRKGPGTNYEYMVYTYFDDVTKTVKTHTSIHAGTNLRILARTVEKQKVEDWLNYWYYVEYKEPVGAMLVYRNAWMYGEFLNVAENKNRWVNITSPENEEALYGAYEIEVEGTTMGSPVSMEVEVKNAYGNTLKQFAVTDYDQSLQTYRFTLSKDAEDFFIGTNTINVIALYSDKQTTNKQITFYVHESQGEKAKPVIYLYPSKETIVSVKVEPKEGLSVSIPDYGKGWTVLAKPTGELINQADGKPYPYLFWESASEKRPVTKAGFVVEQARLPEFFRDKLKILGLNDRETADFLEFWIPILNKGPYYYISFIDQAVLEAEAPLTVVPKPDCVIRVFFDSRPLDKPENVVEQKLLPRARAGFSAVEWGGMRYKD
jgi:hypothetical protein